MRRLGMRISGEELDGRLRWCDRTSHYSVNCFSFCLCHASPVLYFLEGTFFEMPPVGLFPGYSLSLPRSLHHCLHLARALVRIVELFFLSSITLKSYDRCRTEILKFASYS
jgi:hypothetical protein